MSLLTDPITYRRVITYRLPLLTDRSKTGIWQGNHYCQGGFWGTLGHFGDTQWNLAAKATFVKMTPVGFESKQLALVEIE